MHSSASGAAAPVSYTHLDVYKRQRQLVDFLTLERNKARQASITSEILDIVGGAEALKSM